MKALFTFVCGMLILSTHAATTINNANSFSYGANIGWMNWRGDTNNGAVIGEFVCSGFIWGANVGWINLGDGTPPNGIYYQNNSASDFGVNHDGLGNLRGFAWGANIGWLNFTNQSATGATYEGPKVDLLTGRLGGFVWSPNCGWISLSNAIAFVQTDFIHMGADSDADGITDAWETFYFNNLTTATAASDADGDGFSDVREYRADTNPTNAASHLRITRFSASEGGTNVSLTWSSMASRLYRIRETNDVAAPNPWADVGLGLFAPDAGATTTRTFTDTASPQRFFEIEAVRPLSP